MGPPTRLPLASTSRKLTASTPSEYLVAVPTMAVIHIQKTAPGPPMAIAAATPAILPVPMVEDRAVIKAWNGVTSPSSVASRFRNNSLNAYGIFEIERPLSPMDKYRPVNKRRESIGIPHTNPFTLLINDSMERPSSAYSLLFKLTIGRNIW